jgi:hypothetical protein
MTNIPMPTGNIYWRDITPEMKVIDGGNHWQANGKVVYWHGEEVRQAREFLVNRLTSPKNATSAFFWQKQKTKK